METNSSANWFHWETGECVWIQYCGETWQWPSGVYSFIQSVIQLVFVHLYTGCPQCKDKKENLGFIPRKMWPKDTKSHCSHSFPSAAITILITCSIYFIILRILEVWNCFPHKNGLLDLVIQLFMNSNFYQYCSFIINSFIYFVELNA